MNLRATTLIGLTLLAALARLLPHPPNFTPIGATALFAAAHFERRWAAFVVPLAALFLSDLALQATAGLGWYGGWMAHSTGFHRGTGVVYLAVVLSAAVGLLLRDRKSAATVAGAVLASSTVFFLVTNFAWWAGYDLYPHTVTGLVACYEAALPYFHTALVGDVCYSTLLFGGFALAERRYPVLRPAVV